MHRLKDEVLEKLASDELLQAKIALATQRKVSSVARWVNVNSMMLTTETVLHTIRSHYELPMDTKLTTLKMETA